LKTLDGIRSMNAILYLCINEGHEQVDEVSVGDVLENFVLAEERKRIDSVLYDLQILLGRQNQFLPSFNASDEIRSKADGNLPASLAPAQIFATPLTLRVAPAQIEREGSVLQSWV
jgi:hypothetical protein